MASPPNRKRAGAPGTNLESTLKNHTFVIALAAAFLAPSALAQNACDPIGWRLVHQKSISIGERLCVYEKSGVRRSIIVAHFCPFDPC